MFIPTRAAAAFHHQGSRPICRRICKTTLRQVEDMGADRVRAGLEEGRQPQRRRAAGDRRRSCRVSPVSIASLIDAQTLVVGRQAFAEQLLRDQKRVLGRFDTREVEGPPPAGSRRAATVNRYSASRRCSSRPTWPIWASKRDSCPSQRRPASGRHRWAPGGTTTRGRNRRPERRPPPPRAAPESRCAARAARSRGCVARW